MVAAAGQDQYGGLTVCGGGSSDNGAPGNGTVDLFPRNPVHVFRSIKNIVLKVHPPMYSHVHISADELGNRLI